MVEIGKTTQLQVLRMTSHGVFLDGGVLGDILLPKRDVPEGLSQGAQLEVFVYRDSEDRVIATLDTPQIQAGEFALLKVSQVNKIGAFLDVGLKKDLLVPFAEQFRPMEVDRSYLVYCFLNPLDQRLIATTKLDKHLQDQVDDTLQQGQDVDCIIGPKTDLGIKVIVNHQFWGLIHSNQVFRPLKLGQRLRGYVQAIRPDGKLNIGLARVVEAQEGDAEVILRQLRKAKGSLAFNDKSNPDAIKAQFGMSKAAFKRAIGRLYREKQITLDDQGIRLVMEARD